MICPYPRLATAPSGSKLAIMESTIALTCTTPRLINTGPKFRNTARTGRRSPIEHRSKLRQQLQHRRQLHKKLQRTAHNIRPRQIDDQLQLIRASAKENQCRDHRAIHCHRRRVGEQKTAMAIQDAQTPCAHHEQSRPGKDNARQLDRQIPPLTREAQRNHIHQIRSEHNARQHQHRTEQRKYSENSRR